MERKAAQSNLILVWTQSSLICTCDDRNESDCAMRFFKSVPCSIDQVHDVTATYEWSTTQTVTNLIVRTWYLRFCSQCSPMLRPNLAHQSNFINTCLCSLKTMLFHLHSRYVMFEISQYNVLAQFIIKRPSSQRFSYSI